MTFFRRRRPDDWASDHERARVLTALDLVESLPATDAAWLAEHLAGCESCRVRAAAYAEDRLLLRAMRDGDPEPPRDLWARTAAAIEREAEGRGRSRLPRLGAVPIGVTSGLLVVAVVIGVTLFGRQVPDTAFRPTPPPATPGPNVTPGPTPLAIPPNQVAWVQANDAGTYDLYVADFDVVCDVDAGAACAPIEGTPRQSVELKAQPRSVVLSPTEPQIVVVDVGAGTTGGSVFLVPVPTPVPSLDPSATPTLTPVPPTSAPSPTVAPTAPPTAPPTDEPLETPSSSPDSSPGPTPSPIADGATAIISDVIVVGDAAYSPDGTWFAFSARPADGSTGPDIYVWQVGEEAARPVTSDHRSVFSGWLDDLILGSRAVEAGVIIDGLGPSPSPGEVPGPSPAPGDASPDPTDPDASPGIQPVFTGVAFILDPVTSASVDVPGSSWRPAVDMTQRLAVRWEGTLVPDEEGVSWSPGQGLLVVDAWTTPDRPVEPPDPDASPDLDAPSQNPDETAEATEEPADSGSPQPVIVRTVLAEGPVAAFDARWDPTGTRLAVWIADPADPRIGSLRLYVVDPDTGELAASEDRLDGAPALRGFSLERGRLAWITPPGQDGEGSRVHVAAWSEDKFGTIESRPGSDLVVIR